MIPPKGSFSYGPPEAVLGGLFPIGKPPPGALIPAPVCGAHFRCGLWWMREDQGPCWKRKAKKEGGRQPRYPCIFCLHPGQCLACRQMQPKVPTEVPKLIDVPSRPNPPGSSSPLPHSLDNPCHSTHAYHHPCSLFPAPCTMDLPKGCYASLVPSALQQRSTLWVELHLYIESDRPIPQNMFFPPIAGHRPRTQPSYTPHTHHITSNSLH